MAAEQLTSEFDAWSASLPDEQRNVIVLIDVETAQENISVKLLLDGEHDFALLCPSDYPTHSDNLLVESSTMGIWCNTVNEYLLDASSPLTLAQALTKGLHLYGSKQTADDDDYDDDDEEEMDYIDGEAEDDDDDDEHVGMFADDDAFTTDWELEIARKKKRWMKKEESLRKGDNDTLGQGTMKPTGEEAKQASQIFTSTAASGVLTNDLVRIIETEKELGFSAEPIDDNIYQWCVKMTNFSSSSQLGKDLSQVKTKFGYEFIEFELNFAMDLYPFYPPLVKVIRPRLQGAMMQRVTNMEILKLSFWNPTKDMCSVLKEVKAFMEQWARLEVDSPRNDPVSYTEGAYIDIEHHLLRLAMVSEINPRANLQFVMEVSKAPQVKMRTPDKEGDSKQRPQYWAKGVGYGHQNRAGWDIKAYLAAQKEQDKQIEIVLEKILHDVAQTYGIPFKGVKQSSDSLSCDASVQKSVLTIVEGSALIPCLEHYLNIESFLEIGRHSSLYMAVLDMVKLLASHPSLIPLLCPLEGQKESLYHLLQSLERKAASILKHLHGAASCSTEEERVAQNIVDLFSIVDAAVKTHAAPIMRKAELSRAAAEKSLINKPMTLEERYRSYVRPLQFGSATIKKHHYATETRSGFPPPPAQIFRIAQELSSLSSSLPLTCSTSVFVRTDDDQINLMKALITGPEDTPYSNGCFEFDIFFPASYPKGPPKVNLQTTGSGAVRFNPNLYNCGKVCLSLLGTWEGQQGEKWNETSTVLQVLVSIQSLILVSEPYFNEPGYEREIGTKEGDLHNQEYNAEVRANNIRHAMITQLKDPSPGFEEAIRTHFYLKKDQILKECDQWLADARKSSGRVYYSPVHERSMERAVADLRTELAKLKSPASIK
ncbi:probable ubiquitin-conjugating enzyme protein 17 [Oscarella lobularis]|uniref:probable ubiquitin-conjugating enzyme protein 17 n=1 Tax=Oscarella lobularis TaxID=121494 RepID=UPI003313B73A